MQRQSNESAQRRPPDVDDMLAAGMPLWAALALWNEMQGSPVPHDHWWGRLRSLTPTLQ